MLSIAQEKIITQYSTATVFDPYLIWSALGNFERLTTDKNKVGDLVFSLVLQVDQGWRPPKFINPDWLVKIASNGSQSSFEVYTLQLPKKWLFDLMVSPGVQFVQLSLARKVGGRLSLNTGIELPFEAILKEDVIAVIDNDFAFLNENFRVTDVRGVHFTRIAYFWDQDAPEIAPQNTWRPAWPFGYGGELTAKEIDAVLNKPGALDNEIDAYAEFGMKRPKAVSHGTHVLNLAAGKHSADCAGSAKIIAVRLPKQAVEDTSGASMSFNLLNALRYVFDRVGDGKNVVVNFSFGTSAGPHTGNSLIERAMAACIKEQSSRINPLVVLPAGNAFNSNCHAKIKVRLKPKPEDSQKLLWEIGADDTTDNFVEVWYKVNKPSKLLISLITPSGVKILDKVAIDKAISAGNDSSTTVPNPIAAIIHTSKTSTFVPGDCMALIAIMRTRARNDAPAEKTAPYGVWRIEFELSEEATKSLELDAWIERDDSFDGIWPNRQSQFLSEDFPRKFSEPDIVSDPVKREATNNSIANSEYSLVVGGCIALTGELPPYTAAGQEGVGSTDSGTTLVAPTDGSTRLEGLQSAASQSGVMYYMNGTSVAAPQVARWAFNYLKTTCTKPSTTSDCLGDVIIGLMGHIPSRSVSSPMSLEDLRTGLGRLPANGFAVCQQCPPQTCCKRAQQS